MTTAHATTATRGTWTEEATLLPTMEGKVTGIIARHDDPECEGRSLTTVQCSCCLRTYTDITILAVREINFATTHGIGHEPFRRCSECRNEGNEPADADWQRALMRGRKKARQALTNSDEWRTTLATSMSIHSSPKAVEDANEKLRMMMQEADALGEQEVRNAANNA